jgi:transposase
VDDNEVILTGWEQRGKRCYAKKRAFRKARYNIIAGLNSNRLIAPFLFEGHSNTAIYETYLERVLIPALKPGMVLIIDNARFHKSKKIIALIEAAQCEIIYLPPYSPDLNPIEHHWSAVKHAIKKASQCIENFYDAAVYALERACNA